MPEVNKVQEREVPEEEKTPENGWFEFQILRGKHVVGKGKDMKAYMARTEHDTFKTKSNLTKYNCIKTGYHKFRLISGPEKAIQARPKIEPGIEAATMELNRT